MARTLSDYDDVIENLRGIASPYSVPSEFLLDFADNYAFEFDGDYFTEEEFRKNLAYFWQILSVANRTESVEALIRMYKHESKATFLYTEDYEIFRDNPGGNLAIDG